MFSRANTVEAMKHYVFGAGLYGVAVLLYHFNPYYGNFLKPETKTALLGLYVVYLTLAFPYYFFRKEKKLDHNRGFVVVTASMKLCKSLFRYTHHFTRDISQPLPKLEQHEKTALLFMAVKLFFVPLMLNFMVGNAQVLYSYYQQYPFSVPPMRLLLNILYPVLLAAIFFLDTLWFSFGYMVESEKLHNRVKSVEPTALGWAVALASYPPFNGLVSNYFPWVAYDHIPFFSDGWTLFFRSLIVLLLLLYLWATFSLGAKCSNLTNRGIVTRGAYSIIRHPAYVGKNLSWWLMLIPVMSPVVFFNMAVWSFLYYLRAITEERHLISDPDYQAYVKKVKWRFIPFVY